jgi:hypothetical protein
VGAHLPALLPRLAIYDERVKDYRGKLKVIGRIAGQMSSLIFAFLKTDQETLSKVSPGQEPPPPMLYDPEVHRKHQEGHYRSLKPDTQPRTSQAKMRGPGVLSTGFAQVAPTSSFLPTCVMPTDACRLPASRLPQRRDRVPSGAGYLSTEHSESRPRRRRCGAEGARLLGLDR